MLFGHPDLHRVLKGLVKQDATQDQSPLDFCTQMAQILLKNLDDALNSRAVWILNELLEHENSMKLVIADLKKNMPKIKQMVKDAGKKVPKGLEVLLEKLTK